MCVIDLQHSKYGFSKIKLNMLIVVQQLSKHSLRDNFVLFIEKCC